MMQLINVRPFPLIEQGLNPNSDIFGTTCTFEQGKNYLVRAASGKGKSTFLHILYGLRKDFEGEAQTAIDKKNIKNIKQLSHEDWANLRARGVAMVFQDLRLFLDRTARENILLKWELNAADALGRTPPVSQLENWAKRLGIAPFLDQTAETLSYGQRQRVALVRALAQPFDYLLLDEPFSHLDAQNIEIATQIIQEACQQQKAGFVLVSLGEKYNFNYDQIFAL
ncbi:MAG: hypothetical protein RL757_1217 [Bacteroidota bacterium]|jgi:ABC-type lipoprotein export system ATPase subunit